MKRRLRALIPDAPHPGQAVAMDQPYWSLPVGVLLTSFESRDSGLTSAEARQRLARYGRNALHESRTPSWLRTLLGQFASPLVLILVFAALISALAGDWDDALIVIVILAASAILTALQEYRASAAVARLRARTAIHADVLRDGQILHIPATEIVPGDVVMLSAGSLIPADGIVLEARDLFINQAVLTGETFPVEKQPGVVPAAAGLAQRTNCVFMGTSVRSGTGRVLIVSTGQATAFGQIAGRLQQREPETEIERGLRRFGYMLMRVIVVLVIAIFTINVLFHRPLLDSLLFSAALAVGLSPELLPAILSITLARGARDMARQGVIVRRLNAIENLGSMDVLCSDKTGTLTEGVVELDASNDAVGQPSDMVLHLACVNAGLQTGLVNPLDEAILRGCQEAAFHISDWRKIDEIPYDFVRKRLSIVAEDPNRLRQLITKGALQTVLDICSRVRQGDDSVPLDDALRADIEQHFADWSGQGYRVLGVASRVVEPQPTYGRDVEREMIFEGFLLFLDPPKAGIEHTLAKLRQLGVGLKIITGDNRLVSRHLARQIGLTDPVILSGAELDAMRDEALWHNAERTDLFVEVDPNQKERIIRALQKKGHVVGYLGDGINDAPSLHSADVGISVDQAVDVAREAADFVLLEHDLDVLRRGIEEGRATFANTLKYLFITTSANFGNMLSMAVASLFLPFLPLLAIQILLNNFLSDIPAIAISTDRVDPDWIRNPRRWDIRTIRRFMIRFGLISSTFDILTFVVLFQLVSGQADLFRTGWFLESLLTELLVLLVLRTELPFYRSRPAPLLLGLVLIMLVVALTLPYLPFSAYLALYPLPPSILAAMIGISLAYAASTEYAKRRFYAQDSQV